MSKRTGKGMSYAEYIRRERQKKGFDFVCFTLDDRIVCNIKLGEELKIERIRAGLNQTQFGSKLGLSAMTVSNWENEIKVV